jgi:hypothetical protein
VVEKILRLLTNMFENVVCTMKGSKDLAELTVDELVNSLLAHERRKKLKKKISRGGPQARIVHEEKTFYV